MKTVSFKDIPAADWDELVDGSDDAWLMHRAGWIDIEANFFVRRNLSFGLYDRESLVAVQPLYLSDSGTGTANGEKLVHCGLHRHTGLALRGGLSRVDVHAARARAMHRIFHLANAVGADRIQLNSHNLSPKNRTAQRDDIPFWVVEHGFQLGLGFGPSGLDPAPGFAVTNADQIVDLCEPVEVLFARLDEACRRAIRKAEKSQLLFGFDNSADRLERYYALAKASSGRTNEALPPYDYYNAILERFGADGHVTIVFARQGDRDVAALILLIAKGAASFLAGVSDPGSLSLRPNDFIHWQAMLAAKDMGLDVYRFGPIFPEVPSDWPIAKVSSFKSKFGARSVPIIQGSLFLKPEMAEAAILAAAKNMSVIARARSVAKPRTSSLAADIVAHHLRVFGFVNASSDPDGAGLLVADAATEGGWIAARQAAEQGRPVVLLRPSRAAEYFDGVSFGPGLEAPASEYKAAACSEDATWRRLRSMYPSETIHASQSSPVVNAAVGGASWLWLPFGQSGMLLIGTELHRDLTRFRQGDPAAANNRPADAQWGIAGERPTYLFEGQLDASDPHDRMADWWMWTLRDALIRHAGVEPDHLLPFAAKGMVIVTGDDDQAPLDDYRAQKKLLGDLPVTYFLHPLTKHTRTTLEEHSRGRRLEWELHPDALETPHEYDRRFDEQAAWFETLVGRKPRFVRNHGFLNDGYWGHAKAWIRHGISGSSNLPGLDGRILTGSLLPAKLALEGHLTDHWSILTAFGDGVMFALDWDEKTATRAIEEAGKRIVESEVPGILVFNLHPANHVRAACMHSAILRLVEKQGFAAMTLGDAINWFAAREEGAEPVVGEGAIPPFGVSVHEPDVLALKEVTASGRPLKQKARYLEAFCRLFRTKG